MGVGWCESGGADDDGTNNVHIDYSDVDDDDDRSGHDDNGDDVSVPRRIVCGKTKGDDDGGEQDKKVKIAGFHIPFLTRVTEDNRREKSGWTDGQDAALRRTQHIPLFFVNTN